MKVCIILNGEIENYKATKDIINDNYDFIICADGGANHAYEMGIIPDYILGDLDSANNKVVEYYKDNGVKFEKFPSKKNETDTELCIYLANKLKARHIDFIGALGGRVDHMLANINLLYYVRKMQIVPRIIDEKIIMYILIDEDMVITGEIGDTVSLIPVNGDAKGITLKGLEYPLDNYDMKYGQPIGISNVMLKESCKISVHKGSLLVIRNI